MDNIDYEKISNISLRNLFGYISQEVSLFHGTIKIIFLFKKLKSIH